MPPSVLAIVTALGCINERPPPPPRSKSPAPPPTYPAPPPPAAPSPMITFGHDGAELGI